MKELEAKRAKAAAAAASEQAQAQAQKQEQVQAQTDALVSTGLEDALASLEGSYGAEGRLGNVFVIGGGDICFCVADERDTTASHCDDERGEGGRDRV